MRNLSRGPRAKVSGRAISSIGALALTLFLFAPASRGQVAPQEIRSPELRELQTTYLQQLKALNRSIAGAKFPFRFTQMRYVGADPSSAAGQDPRGIEFVRFRGRVVMKITGRYEAALSSALLTANQRAARVFGDIFVPVLELVRKDIPADVACDAIGLEISYHVLGKAKSYEYEGKEILVGVFRRDDAFALAAATTDAARQEILNHSDLYLDGKEFGLALGEREPLDLESLDRGESAAPASRPFAPEAAAPASSGGPLPIPRLLPALPATAATPGVAPGTPATRPDSPAPPARASAPLEDSPQATQQDVARLQAKYQTELDALAKEGLLKFHFVDYAPPSFVLFQDHVTLQLTLRNPARFDREHTSIYKRAAETFDLFLAPELKDILSRISVEVEFPALDVTVLTQFQSPSSVSPEAIEYICPLKALREFTDARITNQELLNQSVVLVNGVRIGLDLQKVE
jgi:hypothetical protein